MQVVTQVGGFHIPHTGWTAPWHCDAPVAGMCACLCVKFMCAISCGAKQFDLPRSGHSDFGMHPEPALQQQKETLNQTSWHFCTAWQCA